MHQRVGSKYHIHMSLHSLVPWFMCSFHLAFDPTRWCTSFFDRSRRARTCQFISVYHGDMCIIRDVHCSRFLLKPFAPVKNALVRAVLVCWQFVTVK